MVVEYYYIIITKHRRGMHSELRTMYTYNVVLYTVYRAPRPCVCVVYVLCGERQARRAAARVCTLSYFILYTYRQERI